MCATSAAAQQFVVDDAGITDAGACQVEAWVSSAAGWLLPACTPLRNLELTLGAGYAHEEIGDERHREAEYVVQAKLRVLPDDPARVGAALVAGAGLGPFAQAAGVPVKGFFAYIPVTYTLAGESVQLHLNAGWAHYREGAVNRLLYGGRADVAVHEHVTVIGELFGEGAHGSIQLGFRFAAIPERLLFDASYGESLAIDTPPIRFALGVAWTPPPFFTPLR